MRSIRKQLLVTLLLILCATFGVTGVLGYFFTSREVGELFDAQLIESSRVLEGVMNHPAAEIDWVRMSRSLEESLHDDVPDNDPMTSGHAYEKKVAIQVWTPDGSLVMRSPSAPEYSLSPLRRGFYQHRSGAFVWHVFTRKLPENSYWLIVAERSDVRGELTDDIAATLGISSLLGLIAAILLMHRGLKREMQPLEDLRSAIGARDPGRLTPIALAARRAELQPVVEAINTLLARVSAGMERERRFLADAAHELRTPLAVLRLQAQNALATPDTAEKDQQLDRLIAGVDRGTHVVEQMLMLARLDANAVPMKREALSLAELTRETLANLAQLAFSRHQELVLTGADDGDFAMQGHGVLLGVLLRNLVDNAIRHSPDGGEITVSLAAASARLTLRVRDSGPGADPALLGELTRRFVRASQSDTHGSGLGLAIVAHIVGLHHGTLHLRNVEPHGLEVEVVLPRGTGADAPPP
jgi:two-component system sensor histidine kinase QseC